MGDGLVVDIVEISEFEGYGVSRDGRFWSRRPVNGRGPLKEFWREVLGIVDSWGYRVVILRRGNIRFRTFKHRAIWESLVGPIPDGMQINHKNGIKTDNRIENLEVVTGSENIQHAIETGLMPIRRGESLPHTALTEVQSREVLTRHLFGHERQNVLASEFGVSPQVVNDVIRGRTWNGLRSGVLQ